MADYAYYTDVYLGSAIPAKAFPGMAQRARDALHRLQWIYRGSIPGEETLKMAVCAMAETIYAHEKRRGGVTGATVGETSVRYESGPVADRQMRRELYEKASIYLDFSRGVAE